ncbi:SWI/SNF complex subunit SWI3B-like [Pyrus ussuriensis x Pyrus communis]|uniref:SWI/SNF complex subunit SWI3B-like n=1 Tax=Pyrus ussuriensis x Pyrus communis TaxID=2448454 RepID=A0A5N5IBG1_9ROSA|nr:SWI/SNF complex subunit SWI3B-like [Pyrus ussuriensis x Pyrus communis]
MNLDLQGGRKGAGIWIYRERGRWSSVLTLSRETLTTPRLRSTSWTWQQLRYRRREESDLAIVDVVWQQPAGVTGNI